MSEVRLLLDTQDFDTRWPNFRSRVTSLAEKLVKDMTETYESQMHAEVSGFIVSGKMDASISSSVNGLTGEASTHSGYGAAVDKGRRGLDIYPKNPGGFLRFVVNGKVIFAKESHPGPAEGHFFIKATLNNAQPRILSMIQTRMNEELKT